MESNWFETIKTKLQEYPAWVFDCAVFGIIGFVAGFVIKNFGKLVLFGILALIVGLAGLHYGNIVSVNVSQIKAILGLAAAHTIDDGIRIYSAWAQHHAIGVISATVAFFIGWKVS